MSIKQLLWFLPFCSFLFGYLLCNKLFYKKTFHVPSIVGKQLIEAASILSDSNVNIRILAKKIDCDLPQGTILSQTPQQGNLIKSHQSVFIVISEKPRKIPSPLLINKNLSDIVQNLEKMGIHNKSYFFLTKTYPDNHCIAQSPTPHTLMKRKNIITYIAKTYTKPVILPDFRNKKITDVIEFLKPHKVNIDILDAKHNQKKIYEEQDIIVDQRPFAGSIVEINDQKELSIQLQVKEN